MTFPSVEYVRALVSKAGVKQGCSSIPVVIDARHIQGADFTAAKVRERQNQRQQVSELTHEVHPNL